MLTGGLPLERKVIVQIIAACALICLCIYTYLLSQGNSPLLYSTKFGSNKTRWFHKVFFGLTAIAFGVCLYMGALELLAILPYSLGNFGEDGDFQSVRSGLAALFAVCCGIPLAYQLDGITHQRVGLDLMAFEYDGEIRILKARLNGSLPELRSLLVTLAQRLEEQRLILPSDANAKGDADYDQRSLAGDRVRSILFLIRLAKEAERELQSRQPNSF